MPLPCVATLHSSIKIHIYRYLLRTAVRAAVVLDYYIYTYQAPFTLEGVTAPSYVLAISLKSSPSATVKAWFMSVSGCQYSENFTLNI